MRNKEKLSLAFVAVVACIVFAVVTAAGVGRQQREQKQQQAAQEPTPADRFTWKYVEFGGDIWTRMVIDHKTGRVFIQTPKGYVVQIDGPALANENEHEQR